MGGKSKPSAPPAPAPAPEPPKPVNIEPVRTAAETTAAYKKARRGRSTGLMSATLAETLGKDTTLGA